MARTEQLQLEIELSNGKTAGNNLKDLSKEARALNREINALTPGTAKFQEKSKDLQKVSGRIKEIKNDIKGVNTNTQKSTKGFGVLNKASGVLKTGFQQAAAALLPLFAFSKVIEFARHIFGLADQYEKLSGTIQKVAGLQDEALDRATIKVQGLSKTFDKETNEITKSANALSKQMNISFDDSLKLIEKGLLAGADVNDDFLNQINEYSTQFNNAGASAEEFISVLVSGEGEGIFNDKAADTFKEFNLRIREQTKPTKEALEGAFGKKFASDLFKGINSGAISSTEAIKMVSAQMDDTKISTKALQTVMADVFGGAGEDAGLEYIQSLKDVDLNLDNLIDTTNDLTRRQQEQLKLEEELAAAQLEVSEQLSGQGSIFKTLSLQVQTFLTKGASKIIEWFQNVYTAASPIIDTFFDLGSEIGDLFTEVKKLVGGLFNLSEGGSLLNTIMQGLSVAFKIALFPFRLFIGATTKLIRGFISLNNKFEVVRGTIGALMGVFTNFFSNIKQGLTEAFSGLGDILEGNFTEGIKKIVSGGGTTAFAAFKGIGTAAKEGYAKGVNNMITDPLEEETQKAEKVIEESNEKVIKKLSDQQDTIRKKRAEFNKAEIEAQKAIEELKLSLLDEGLEKEIVKQNLAAERKIENLKGTAAQQEEQRKLIMLQLQQQTDELLFNEEQKRIEANNAKKLEIQNQLQKEKLTQLDLYQQQEINNIDLAAIHALESEEALNLKRLELVKTVEEQKLQLLIDSGTATSLEIADQNAKIIAADKALADEQIRVKKEQRAKEQQILGAAASAASDLSSFLNELDTKDKKKKRQLIAVQKAAAISEVFINTAKEVSGYMSHPASIASLGTLGAIQAGIAVARGGVQIAKIGSVKEKFAKGGVAKGPSHAAGGIQMINSQTGNPVGEMEGNEIILTSGVYKNPVLRAYASQINEMAGGRRFALGGPVNPISSGTSQIEVNTTTQKSANNSANDIVNAIIESNKINAQAIQKLENTVSNWPKMLKVVNDPRDTEEALQVVNEIIDEVNV